MADPTTDPSAAPASAPAPAPATTGLDWSSIGNSILNDATATLEASASGFLASHPSALAFLKTAALEAAKALVLYAVTSDPAAKADLKAQVDLWRQGLKEESESIIKDVADQAPSVFLTILEDVGKLAIGIAPTLLKSVAI